MKKKNSYYLCALSALAIAFAGCTAEAEEPEDEAVVSSETEETENSEESEKIIYDTSEAHESVILNDGDEITGGIYTAEADDESVLDASNNINASVTGSVLQKLSGNASDVDDASFTGLNAAVRVYDGAAVTLKDCIIEADAENATGVFAYNGGTAAVSDSEITVTGGGAGGVQVAGGGILYGNNLTVTSSSKAAIRSDRGGGVMVLDGGTYISLGSNGCPSIYSTADITVKNAECISENSRAVIIEGENSVTLENCTLYGNDQSTKQGSVKANVLLYQSASGDASDGTSVFTMSGGSMTSYSGAMFYCTNTASVINLKDADLVLSEDGTLLIVSAGRWGKDGNNGGTCTLNADNQTLAGDIIVDGISSLTFSLSDSSYTGCIDSEGSTAVVMDENSTWTLSGDSYITSFEGNLANVITNGYSLYVNGVKTA